jgi:hypothetical protein
MKRGGLNGTPAAYEGNFALRTQINALLMCGSDHRLKSKTQASFPATVALSCPGGVLAYLKKSV